MAAVLLLSLGVGFGLVVAAPAEALATTVFAAQGGSDANDCATPATACGTVSHALTQVDSGGTVQVSGTIHDNVSVSKSVTITGANTSAGAPAVLDGSGLDRVVTIRARNVTLDGLTIRNGSGIDGGGIASFSGGLTVSNSTISGNSSINGPGMYNGFGSSTTVTNTTISGNTQDQCCASFGGGGILNFERLTVISSTISGNSADDGGGINNNRGTTEIVASTISGNAAKRGGGIMGTRVTLTDSTVSGNSAIFGGGIWVTAAPWFTITGSTIVGNSASGHSGGIFNNLGSAMVGATILGSNTGGNCGYSEGSVWVSVGYNLESGTFCPFSGPGDLHNVDPLLGPLQDNGGPTPTMALPAASPAVEAIPHPTTVTVHGSTASKRRSTLALSWWSLAVQHTRRAGSGTSQFAC